MEPFRYHVFVCDQRKPEGAPCCSARGSARVIDELQREIRARGLEDEVQVTTCGSLGLCEHGPNLVVYPDGVWYSGVAPDDVGEIVGSHLIDGAPVERLMRTDPAALRSEMLANRQRRLAALRARDAAGALPDDLNDRIRAFQESRAILTALELDVFSTIGEGARAEDVARVIGADPRATEMLLNALAAVDLLCKRDDVFLNSPAAARYFSASSRDNARTALLHSANLWPRWSTLTECVRTGTAQPTADGDGRGGADWTEAFIAAMHRNAAERAPHVVRAVGAAEVRRMLDIGGGSGAYSIAFAQANPELRADILDLPVVAPIAQRHIDAAGVGGQVRVRPGDLHAALPDSGYDLVFISAICHMLSPEQNEDLLRRSHAALRPGGRIVIQDFVLEPDKTAPRFAALFALNMLVGTRSGSSYSEPEYASWLGAAGFREVRRVRLPGPADLMIGVRC